MHVIMQRTVNAKGQGSGFQISAVLGAWPACGCPIFCEGAHVHATAEVKSVVAVQDGWRPSYGSMCGGYCNAAAASSLPKPSAERLPPFVGRCTAALYTLQQMQAQQMGTASLDCMEFKAERMERQCRTGSAFYGAARRGNPDGDL